MALIIARTNCFQGSPCLVRRNGEVPFSTKTGYGIGKPSQLVLGSYKGFSDRDRPVSRASRKARVPDVWALE